MNTLKLFFISFFLQVVSLHNLNAQELSLHNNNEEIFTYRVKQISEFIDRFNYKFDEEFKEVLDNENITLAREEAIYALFDLEDPRFNIENIHSAEYATLVSNFVSHCIENKQYIDKSSEYIIANATVEATLNDKPVDFTIELQQENVAPDMLKWVINDVHGELFNVFNEDSTILRFLPPSSDELDFMELRRALKDIDYLDQYTHKSFEYSPLSVMLYLINQGILEVQSIMDVTYIIEDLPGWQITVKDCNRNMRNSGWLITDLKKTSLTP